MDQQEFQSQMLEFKTQMLEFVGNTNRKFESIDQRFNRIDERFNKIDERFGKIDEQFHRIDERLESMQGDIYGLKEHARHVDNRMDYIADGINTLQHQHNELTRKIEDIYQSRNTVKIKFGWEWGAVSLAIAFLASGIASGLTKFVWR